LFTKERHRHLVVGFVPTAGISDSRGQRMMGREREEEEEVEGNGR